MKRILLFLAIFFYSSLTALPVHAVQVGANQLTLVLAPELSLSIVEEDWASGKTHTERPAVLELRNRRGEMLDRLELDAPLARLHNQLLRGTHVPTYLVSVDLTQEAGSYNGPLTFPVEVKDNHIRRVHAQSSDGRLEPVVLALTGKAAWKKIAMKKADHFLTLSCQPQDNGFVTIYRRYFPARDDWHVLMRTKPEFLESDGDFPCEKSFP